MSQQQSAPFPLLALPDPCLLVVLQCCATTDQLSLFSVARAHSRLHQAAVAVLRSIDIPILQQQRLDSVLLYLDRHGSHVNSLNLRRPLQERLTLHQLPLSLQLHSLQLSGWRLQLLPGNGFQGVLGPAAAERAPPLKHLDLYNCALLDGAEGLAAALLQLPALEHFSLECLSHVPDSEVRLPLGVLQQLQQLTHLTLAGPAPQDPDLQPLQVLTHLADLRLAFTGFDEGATITSMPASMLSGMLQLTCLSLSYAVFEPDALAGKTKLQHLMLRSCSLSGGAAGTAALLSHLQHMQQLTHLNLHNTLRGDHTDHPVAAYSALTASTKLQHLNIAWCMLPAGVWQHMFPAGRQLPQLQHLDIWQVRQPGGARASAPDASRLLSCCPNLQRLRMRGVAYTQEQLKALREGVKEGGVWV
jgi:hypothetical protein